MIAGHSVWVGDYRVSLDGLRAAFDRRAVLAGLAAFSLAGVCWCLARTLDDRAGISAFLYLLGGASMVVGVIEGAAGRAVDRAIASAVVPAVLASMVAFVDLLIEGTDSGQRGIVLASFISPLAVSMLGIAVGLELGRLVHRLRS